MAFTDGFLSIAIHSLPANTCNVMEIILRAVRQYKKEKKTIERKQG